MSEPERKRAAFSEPRNIVAVFASQLELLSDEPLTELAMQLTEQERIGLCRTNRRMRRFCRSAGLYRRLVSRDYPEFKENWKKFTIVGGSRDPFVEYVDGTWALYYRLLQRSLWCRRAMMLYWGLRSREENEAAMVEYQAAALEQRGSLPIEYTCQLQTLLEFGRDELMSKVPLELISVACTQLFGKTALPWARFYAATRYGPFRHLLSTVWFSKHRPQFTITEFPPLVISDAETRERETAFLVSDSTRLPELVRLVSILVQTDGPSAQTQIAVNTSKQDMKNTLLRVFDNFASFYQPTSEERVAYFIGTMQETGIYAEQLRPEDCFWRLYARLEMRDILRMVYLAEVDYGIATMQGDNRRFWFWIDGIWRNSRVYQIRPSVRLFLDALKRGMVPSADGYNLRNVAGENIKYYSTKYIEILEQLQAALRRSDFSAALDLDLALYDAFASWFVAIHSVGKQPLDPEEREYSRKVESNTSEARIDREQIKELAKKRFNSLNAKLRRWAADQTTPRVVPPEIEADIQQFNEAFDYLRIFQEDSLKYRLTLHENALRLVYDNTAYAYYGRKKLGDQLHYDQ